jgi:hypothetical protein
MEEGLAGIRKQLGLSCLSKVELARQFGISRQIKVSTVRIWEGSPRLVALAILRVSGSAWGQAKQLLPPKLVDRLIYAAKNFPEIGWLEILPKDEGKEVRETYIVYECLGQAFQRIRAAEYPPDSPSDTKDRRKRQALKTGCLILAFFK